MANEGPSMKKKKKLFLIIGAALILVIFVIVAILNNQEKLIPVSIEKIEKGKIISIVTANGTVEAEKNVDISADIMGRIIDLPVVEGQYVNKGDLLVDIDKTEQQTDVAQAKALLAAAVVTQEQAQIEYDRISQLWDGKLTSKAEYDLGKTELDQAKASVAQYQAYLDNAIDQLSKCIIKAPIAGTITTLNSEEGENVIVGTMNNAGTVIMVISDLSKIVVKADVDETDIARLKLGQEVKITLDAFPDTTFAGTVTEIGNAALSSSDNVTNFEVTVLIVDQVPDIKPGMNATVDITTDTREDVMKVPIQSLVMRTPSELAEKAKTGEKKTDSTSTDDTSTISNGTGAKEDKDEKEIEGVFIVDGKTAKFTPVTTGVSDQQYIEIKTGLELGQEIVTGSYKTLRSLKNGDKIKPSENKFDKQNTAS